MYFVTCSDDEDELSSNFMQDGLPRGALVWYGGDYGWLRWQCT